MALLQETADRECIVCGTVPKEPIEVQDVVFVLIVLQFIAQDAAQQGRK